jgi:beta-mannosidase
MKQIFDLSKLNWQLFGFNPSEWQFSKILEMGMENCAEISLNSVPVPGSVQAALRQANILPDWNLGLNARKCEWVENRHWIYQTELPDAWFAQNAEFRLHCHGLDYSGWIRLNGVEIATFKNTHLPHRVNLTPFLSEKKNVLQIIFDCPPRWLGQFGRTSEMTEWKPRFNYYWDWTSRLVQIGIWDGIFVEAVDSGEIQNLKTEASVDFAAKKGRLAVTGQAAGAPGFQVRASLKFEKKSVREQEISLADFQQHGFIWENLPVELWWPNGFGAQPLYSFEMQLLDAAGKIADQLTRRIGFRDISWQPCAGSVPESDPWICVVNGQPVFLQGVNWTPIRPNFADLTPADYRKRLELYHDLGCTIFRVWGGAFLERTWFYDLCDELGIFIWQEFPLSSSGVDNYPPDDPKTIAELSEVVESYIQRRHSHPALIIWSGGNELTKGREQNEPEYEIPIDTTHSLIRRFAEITQKRDPSRRFIPTSPTGPIFTARAENYGKGIHWDIHGPWNATGPLNTKWQVYWETDDALLRSEVGAPGPSPVEIIERYKGECASFPATFENPLWRRTSWWVEWPEFVAEHQREPKNLAEYVSWGQQRQADALAIAAFACKNRFPRCGGFIVWMGHDSFPCSANTAIIDFEGNPKPAALALGKIFNQKK